MRRKEFSYDQIEAAAKTVKAYSLTLGNLVLSVDEINSLRDEKPTEREMATARIWARAFERVMSPEYQQQRRRNKVPFHRLRAWFDYPARDK